MRPALLTVVACFVVLLPVAAANHCDSCGCTPTEADPATVNQVQLPDGRLYYIEERGVPAPLDSSPRIPGSGFLVGEGTWVYEETNGIQGLQRGGIPLLPPCEHWCFEDPITDENCGFGPDTLLF